MQVSRNSEIQFEIEISILSNYEVNEAFVACGHLDLGEHAQRVAKKHFAETASQVPKRVTVTVPRGVHQATTKDFVSSLVGIACGIAIAETIGPDFLIESAMDVRKKLLSPAGSYHESEFWRGPLC